MITAVPTESSTLTSLIEARQTALELSDQDLCTALGFERSIALTLIKAGSMRFPINKLPALAAALDLDLAELFTVAMNESSPDLLKTIMEAFNPLHMTAAEVSLIKHLRELSGNQQCGPIVFPGHKIIALIAA
jgi:hypothetical protein